jgi:hypothetical protein
VIWAEHVKNRNEIPPEELAKYSGKHVAWNLDGNRILGGNEDPLQLVADLKALGYQPEDYILSFVGEGEVWVASDAGCEGGA